MPIGRNEKPILSKDHRKSRPVFDIFARLPVV